MSAHFQPDVHFSSSVKQIAVYHIFLACIMFFTASRPGMADNALSDEEKKSIVYAMYQDYKKNDFPDVTDIYPQQALALLKSQKVIFVDTRSQSEMDISMLPHSISQANFQKHPEKYKDKTVIVYCTISYRSGKFAQEMKTQKIPVQNLVGGILAWVLEGGKVYNQAGETKQIHVYGEKWDYPAKGYTSVKFGFFEKLFGS